jgi:hypothetical protein
MILGFIISKEGKLLNSKEDSSNSKHVTTQKSIIDSSIQWDGTILQMYYQKLCCYYGTYH